jgi:serine/threonine protein kinase/dienelactone hydrolase
MGLNRDDPAKPEGASRGAAGSSDLSRELTAFTPSPGAGSRGPHSASIARGTTLDHFEVLELLGAGGFGEVYRARDTRLERMVAIKVLPEDFARDAERRERFRREAIAASGLKHPNICTVYELVEANGRHLIVMELVEGKTLHALLANGPLPVGEALPIALQIADAIAAAHRAGILHRDIKSGNIALDDRGQVKVFDFGLAKLFGTAPEKTEGPTEARLTDEGASLGTITHMSPEQLLGKAVDRRSDLFSFGVVLYEMVTGRLPFLGSTTIAVADAILHGEPRDLGDAPVPEKLKAIIRKLLEKDPEKRYASAEDVHAELKVLADSLAPGRKARLSRNTRIALVAAGLVAIATAGWLWHRASRTRWARETALPEIGRLLAEDDFTKAAGLAQESRRVLPNNPALEKLWMQATLEVSPVTDPPGADVSYRPMRGQPPAWESVGRTPLLKIRVPKGFYLWRFTRAGFIPAYRICPTWSLIFPGADILTVRLDPEGSLPAGMIRVPGGKIDLATPGLDQLPSVGLDDYLIDRTEVTNAEYQKFVDAGGYRTRDFWKQPLVRGGRTLTWDEAIALFRDTTGQPGPATWELGHFAKGQERYPVAGVSWYEAAAYAEFTGKSLPTVYHWNWAAQTRASMLIVPGSNFSGTGTVPVGGDGALSGFGTADMAGNVKEWCWNESAEGKRYILGGGFGEPTYMFIDQDAQSPWDRRPNYGFRCVKLFSPTPSEAVGRIEGNFRDYSKEKPASDELFRAYKGLYAYDKGELNARVEATETTEDWTREKVSFNAAYGNERVIAYLYLPKNVAPPWQTVVYFPGSDAIYTDTFALSPWPEFVPKSGRALLVPVYKGTYERRDQLKTDNPEQTALWRDHVIEWSKDLGRSLDYLQTRKDIESEKLAYFGWSWGGATGPILLAVENRFRAAILGSGGLEFQKALPEADQINFVPRVKVPVLMLNGRYDHFFPVESSQVPLYRLLGTPEKDKKHVLYETGHAPPRKEVIRESLDWLDKYLGPVKR